MTVSTNVYSPPPLPPRVLRPPWWPSPESEPILRLPAGALLTGLLVGLLDPSGPIGLGVVLAALVAAATITAVGWRRTDNLDRVLGAVAVLLAGVAAWRASEWLVVLCLLGALGLGAVVTVRARRWAGLLLALPLLGVGAFRSLPWLARPLARVRGRRYGPWLRGGVIGLAAVWLVGALLVSADDAFAQVVQFLVPSLPVDQLFGRVVLGLVAAGVVLGGGFGVLAPPHWDRMAAPLTINRGAAAEWLLPLVLVDALLAVFLAVQATVLFGGGAVVHSLGVSYADRARQGFGQLVAVTLLVGLLLVWAAARCDRARRRPRLALVLAGGTLVALTLLLVTSALRRLWLYEEAYGWTVLRLVVGCFEIWLGVVLVGAALVWALNRTALLPRSLALAAGIGLLALAVIGPDAAVAAGNVHRLRTDGRIDVGYLRELSPDAVPELSLLPEPYRSEVLSGVSRDELGQGWYSFNVGRWRAARVLGD